MRSVIVFFVLSVAAALAFFGCFDSAPPAESNVGSGKALAGSLACASCHGADFSGSESPVGQSGAYAANLTPDPDTGLGRWTDDDIARAIRTGVDDGDASLCATMPRFDTLSSDQTSALVAYLRSLPPIAHDIPESDCAPQPDLDDAGLDDAGVVIVTDDAAPPCTGYADPQTNATCHACAGASCQPNGCFGGWYCDLATYHCVAKPAQCE